jgi:hypothetical protein
VGFLTPASLPHHCHFWERMVAPVPQGWGHLLTMGPRPPSVPQILTVSLESPDPQDRLPDTCSGAEATPAVSRAPGAIAGWSCRAVPRVTGVASELIWILSPIKEAALRVWHGIRTQSRQ